MTADVSSALHDDYLELARRAAEVMGATLAGVDVIAPDVTQPMANGFVVVNEVNTTPDLMLSHFDVSGAGDAIATVGRLLGMAFRDGITSRRSA